MDITVDYAYLATTPRLLIEADLWPLQGDRFQPTGFADLGPARYIRPGGTEMLLVESAQSVANRMELACWDDASDDLISDLRGLPYIKVTSNGTVLTNSILEAHRINSEYVMKDARRVTTTGGKREVSKEAFSKEFAEEIGYKKDERVNWKKFYVGLLKYDANSLIHGCFLEEIAGRLRITRILSGFIEASGIVVAESGGVKNNIVQPDLKGGEGNVPFHRTEFTAQQIKAYFNLDLALLSGYGLDDTAKHLLIALSLLKVRRFLSAGLRLRTACDLEMVGNLKVTRPEKCTISSEEALLAECKRLIERCEIGKRFAGITELEWKPSKKKSKSNADTDVDEAEVNGEGSGEDAS